MKAVYSPLLLGIFGLFVACSTAPEFDAVLANARIAEFHGDSLSYQSVHLALRDGRIAAVVPAAVAVPSANDTTDLSGSFVYPGFIDAHAHFLALGQALETVDLVGTRSWAECVDRVQQLADAMVHLHHGICKFANATFSRKVGVCQGWEMQMCCCKSYNSAQTRGQHGCR